MAEGIPLEPRMNALMRAGQMQGMQQQAALRDMQMQQLRQAMAAEAEQRKRQEAQQAQLAQAIGSIPSPRLAPLGGNAAPTPQNAARLGNDPRLQSLYALMQANPSADTAKTYLSAAYPEVKVKDYKEVRMPDGSVQIVGFTEQGKPVPTGNAPFRAPEVRDFGGYVGSVDQITGKVSKLGDKTMSAAERAADARARERLEFEKNKPAGDAAPKKPLPASALKMQQDALDAIGVVGGINADLKALEDQIDKGTLAFGPISNVVNAGRNMAGMSSQESRNFATFRSNMERLRNESLRLNTGVQTDGDAQRAWNELFQNITDTNLVKQRLQEIQRINARGAELQKLKLDQVRANYGYEPLDVTPQAVQPPALKGEVSNKPKVVDFGSLK